MLARDKWLLFSRDYLLRTVVMDAAARGSLPMLRYLQGKKADFFGTDDR
jgi:hypothetical protein